jgi:glucosamine--fructose-6-phosphate aminotransferase (isomerizing)
MCGIIGGISKNNVTTKLIDGLHHMEYRGYDSAGICTIDANKEDSYIKIQKIKGRVSDLSRVVAESNTIANIGIGHTRWATHGEPSERNAHPFLSNNFALVHNGIIENYQEIKEKMQKEGYNFHSDTDSEVVVHYLDFLYTKNKYYLGEVSEDELIIKTLNQATVVLKGAYAIAIICNNNKGTIYAVRKGSPLVIGRGDDGNYLASDFIALLKNSKNYTALSNNDIAKITKDEIKIFNNNIEVKRDFKEFETNPLSIELGNYQHYMKKEIHEQASIVKQSLKRYQDILNPETLFFGKDNKDIFKKAEAIQIVACGSSYNAAMIAKYWIEESLNIICLVSIASEFNLHKAAVPKNCLLLVISQSGETADTLTAIKESKDRGYLTSLAITNVVGSSISREVDFTYYMEAGPEIGVASTKCFLSQVLALNMLASCKSSKLDYLFQIKILPQLIKSAIEKENEIINFSNQIKNFKSAMFLGRGIMAPLATEGALKLKEISYIHAESYPAGELKHGPLALIDAEMPVIAFVPNDHTATKMLSSLEEVKARGGNIFIFTNKSLQKEMLNITHNVLCFDDSDSVNTSFMFTIGLQLLSYHTALLLGHDVDKPRNLAKSVTVE